MTESIRKTFGGGFFLLNDTIPQEIFTPEDFTEEHKLIARAIEDFLQGEIISRADEIEMLNNELSRELMGKAGKLGFLGMDLPERYGGMELDKMSTAILSEKFGFGAGSFNVTESNHTCIGTLPLALFGTSGQKQKYLPGLCSGKLIGAFGLTEPQAGSDALNSLTTATLSKDGTHYLLNGSKQFITNAGFADIIFAYAKVDGKFFTAFILEKNWEGISVDEEEEKMGIHGTSTRAYHFDNVKVPVGNVLGEVGKGHVVALNSLNMGRYRLGASCVGSAKRAFYEAVKYAKQRKQFGKPICDFGLIKEKIGKMAIRIFAAESMVFRTAGLIQAELQNLDMTSEDIGISTAKVFEQYSIECAINKIYGSEIEDYVIDEEVQIFGGYGYIRGNHPELAYRNARINRIWEGTNEINRIALVNTLIRMISKGVFGLMSAFQAAFEEIKDLEPINYDQPENLDAQIRLLKMAKEMLVLVFGITYQKYGEALRDEEELIGTISNIIIEIYSLESALLRTQKMLNSQNSAAATIPIKITKVLFSDSIDKISSLARETFQAVASGELLVQLITVDRMLMVSPPINILSLRREIADAMIRYGCFFV